ncbi:4367_t:CDS:2 [Diversispora eburnea]|uniref:4367_t:CDS:1 n=1 Tax=Diversispora eburnea TaxID=1213867 RepID=A0A9N8YQ98_9GLOM|nr:4367_t:CDS:2 [Diversispora eburnea]
MSTYCESVLSDLSDSSDLSETSSTISTNLKVEMTNIELKEGKLYATHDDFITAIKDYAKSLGFSISNEEILFYVERVVKSLTELQINHPVGSILQNVDIPSEILLSNYPPFRFMY